MTERKQKIYLTNPFMNVLYKINRPDKKISTWPNFVFYLPNLEYYEIYHLSVRCKFFFSMIIEKINNLL